MENISRPIAYNAAQVTILANNPPVTGDDWSNAVYNSIKTSIKEYHSIMQEDTCCYCQVNLRHGGYGEPIEHIVPKKDRPQWMFEPRNLALSCYPCNTKKNADNTLSDTGLHSINYPANLDGFIIYHPHYGNYSTHIAIFHQFFLRPIDEIGRQTFETCDLYRIELALTKAKQKDWKEEPFKIQVIEKTLLDPTITDEIRNQCIDISTEIIRRAKLRARFQI